MQIYVVQPGDTLYSIGQHLGLSPGFLARCNGLREPYRLAVGQSLLALYPLETVTVRPGDTLASLARENGTSLAALYRMNPNLSGSSRIYPGQTLVTRLESAQTRGAFVTGYAYANVDPAILRGILPYASALAPFTYGFTPEAQLVPMQDAQLLTLAREFAVRPILHLSTLTQNGTFSALQAGQVLRDEALQRKLAAAVLLEVQQKGYAGLDVDFEYLGAELAEAYAQFLQLLHDQLAPLGLPLLAALAPKTSSDQRGSLYEGHDYAAIGAACDAVLLMTYEWGYTYGPPMAVAPLPQVRAVLDYAVTEIPPEKIFLGVPLYGYDWPLPFVQGETRAESLSPAQAVARALAYGVPILYDETAQSPHFDYTDASGRAHTVWFEDARSAEAKLRLIDEYDLQGAGLWNLTRDFPAFYTVLPALYDIELLP